VAHHIVPAAPGQQLKDGQKLTARDGATLVVSL
jgi:hypothetical protein